MTIFCNSKFHCNLNHREDFVNSFISFAFYANWYQMHFSGRHDTQHDDTQYKNTKHNVNKNNGTLYNQGILNWEVLLYS